MPRIALGPLPRSCPVAALADVRAIAVRLAAWGGGVNLECVAHASCDGEAMLVVEQAGGAGGPTWVVTAATGGRLRLEAMVDEAHLDLLAEGPVDRILAHLGAVAARPRVAA
jgi:hypothetical protein